MTTEIISGMLSGIHGVMVTIQTDVSDGLPVMQMIGYLASEVKEAKDRVRTAIKNSSYKLPPKRISVNLSPGDIKKNGVSFDLAIAVSLLSSIGIVVNHSLDSYIILGELALDGRLCPIRGILPIVHEALRLNIRKCIIPARNAGEAEMLEDMEVFAFHTLSEVVTFLNNPDSYCDMTDYEQDSVQEQELLCHPSITDFSRIRGQESAKKGLMIAASGFHNVLLEGPPGCGKSMLASALPGIMPDLSWQEKLEVLMIHSTKGILKPEDIHHKERPYRAVGSGITRAGLLGGGKYPVPGEITLAHHGVMFIDELTEMDRSCIELLRNPLETHQVHVIRNEQQVTFPADFILICASNMCPCGRYPSLECSCTPGQIRRYQARISGPIRDRIDLFIPCDLPSYEELSSQTHTETSQEIRQKVKEAWDIQKKRQGNIKNSRLKPEQLEEICPLDESCKSFMERIYDSFHLTGRSYFKILKTARTIADLRSSNDIALSDLQEALQFRSISFQNIP